MILITIILEVIHLTTRTVKRKGVDISNKINFYEHCNIILSKANQKFGSLAEALFKCSIFFNNAVPHVFQEGKHVVDMR